MWKLIKIAVIIGLPIWFALENCHGLKEELQYLGKDKEYDAFFYHKGEEYYLGRGKLSECRFMARVKAKELFINFEQGDYRCCWVVPGNDCLKVAY